MTQRRSPASRDTTTSLRLALARRNQLLNLHQLPSPKQACPYRRGGLARVGGAHTLRRMPGISVCVGRPSATGLSQHPDRLLRRAVLPCHLLLPLKPKIAGSLTLRLVSFQGGRPKNQAYSITSSAWASSVGGTSRPSALAVLTLITKSNFSGACSRSSGCFDRGQA